MSIREKIAEWRRGCSNGQFCEECTGALIDAIKQEPQPHEVMDMATGRTRVVWLAPGEYAELEATEVLLPRS